MCVIIRGAVLLLLLCFWTQNSVDAIAPNVLGSIIRDIRKVTNMNNQYSFAAVLPRVECIDQGQHKFGDTTQDIRAGLNSNNRIYVGQRVIAARPMQNTESTDHSEYRLLVTDKGHSHMSNLINRWQEQQSCTIFFTLNSPCGKKCANPAHPYNILPFLNVFNNLDHNWVAFVFQDIFHFQLTATREEMLALLQSIHKSGGNIPVYRCNANNVCTDCMADPNPQTNRCLDGMPMCVIIRGAVLLFLLCFWTQNSVDAIRPEVLGSIIRDIRNVANINNQYSFAVVLPRHECNHLQEHDFTDFPEQIHDELNSETFQYMYVGQRVIAARPLFREEGHTDHSEYRLLVSRKGRSEMSDLIDYWNHQKSCTVFFTLNSPCGKKCANPRNRFNILQYLNVFNSLNKNWVAFVFQDIFHFQLTATRTEMLELLQSIHESGGNIPVYRCNANNVCTDCMADPNLQTNRCLDGMPV